jgi:hypothetical protein
MWQKTEGVDLDLDMWELRLKSYDITIVRAYNGKYYVEGAVYGCLETGLPGVAKKLAAQKLKQFIRDEISTLQRDLETLDPLT